MFVDTSAIIAIVAGESDRAELLDKLSRAPGRYVSSLVVLESVMRLSSLFIVEPEKVREIVEDFLTDTGIEIITIEPDTAWLAVEAFTRYGKGRGHAARLNLADCMSYACAKNRNVPLLYKGNDFAKTDLA